MNSLVRLFILLFLLTSLSACSLPLKVTKVESMADPVKGVRYFLKRPSYVAGLEIDFDKAKFLDTSKLSDAKLNEPAIKKKKMAILNVSPEHLMKLKPKENQKKEESNFYFANDPWVKGDQIKNNIYCVQMPEGLRINLQQKMEGTPILFEAKSRITPPHWFADSESSITLDDDGYLTAIMAGEDDKSLEFIQAVASLAVKAFGLSEESSKCLKIDDDDNFKAYVTRYFKLTARKINLEEKLNETYQKIEMKDGHVSNSRVSSATKSNINNAHVSVIPDTPKQMKLRFELIDLLKEEIASIDDELKKLQYELPRQFFEVKAESGGDSREDIIQPKSEVSEFWLTFTLTRQ